MNIGPDVAVGLIECKEKPEHFLVQHRSKINKQYPGWLEFPGGKIEINELPENALIRELKEEVGIKVTSAEHFVVMKYLFPSGLYHTVHFFEVTSYENEPIGAEGQSIGWLTLYQILTYPNMLPLNRAAATILTTRRHPDILDKE